MILETNSKKYNGGNNYVLWILLDSLHLILVVFNFVCNQYALDEQDGNVEL